MNSAASLLDSGDDRTLCGWRVRSLLPLDDLPPWRGDDRAPDIQIMLGPVPPLPEPLRFQGPLHRMALDGQSVFTLPSIAAYWVAADGSAVVVEPQGAVEQPVVKALLFGTVLALLCRARGYLPLHACAIGIETPSGPRAVALAAATGTGKSTLTAAFRRRGHVILSDDVAVLAAAASGSAPPVAMPALPRIRLWEDMLDHFGRPAAGLERIRARLGKFSVPVTDGFAAGPLPLAGVYHMERVFDPRHCRLERLRGLDAVKALLDSVYQRRLFTRDPAEAARFAAQGTRLAGGISAHRRLAYLHGTEHLDETVDAILADCAET